jgi:hypothetical protein
MGSLLATLIKWAIFAAVVTTVGGWWGMAITLTVAFVLYLVVGRRSPTA